MSSDAALRVAPRDRLLGELLLDAGLVGPADLERGLALQLKLGGRIGSVLMRIGAVSEDNLLQVLSRQLGLPVMGADVPAPDEDMVRLTAAQAPTGIDWLLDQQLLVWPGEGSDLFCAARDPLLPALREAMRHAYPGRKVLWCLCRAQDLERMLDALAHHARSDEWGGGDEQQLRAMAEEAPVVELVSNLMAQAVEQRASDIHLEPEERIFAVRFRIDGVLHTRPLLSIRPADRPSASVRRAHRDHSCTGSTAAAGWLLPIGQPAGKRCCWPRQLACPQHGSGAPHRAAHPARFAETAAALRPGLSVRKGVRPSS